MVLGISPSLPQVTLICNKFSIYFKLAWHCSQGAKHALNVIMAKTSHPGTTYGHHATRNRGITLHTIKQNTPPKMRGAKNDGTNT